ncbi:MAG: hypothetical protein ACRDTQ_16295 [Micromonosporaceae bacterium]
MSPRKPALRTRPLLAEHLRRRPGPKLRVVTPPRSPVLGLSLLLLLALLTFFVAWVSAEPFWIAMGHYDTGNVRVTRCVGEGDLGTRCVGAFTSDHGGHALNSATISGAEAADRAVGRSLPAKMVSPDGRIAYVGDAVGLTLRWSIGIGLLLLIGFGVAAGTGAWRFRGRARGGAVITSLAAPFLLAGAVLAVTY